MKRRWSRFARIEIFIWGSAIILAIWSAFGPLLKNAWASQFWHQIPCHISEDHHYFFYEVNEVKYGSSRMDLWQKKYDTGKTDNLVVEVSPGADNDTCWVSPFDPADVVLRLNAFSTLEKGEDRFATGALVLFSAGCITFAVRRRKKKGDVVSR